MQHTYQWALAAAMKRLLPNSDSHQAKDQPMFQFNAGTQQAHPWRVMFATFCMALLHGAQYRPLQHLQVSVGFLKLPNIQWPSGHIGWPSTMGGSQD
jgi:hypothetical protein